MAKLTTHTAGRNGKAADEDSERRRRMLELTEVAIERQHGPPGAPVEDAYVTPWLKEAHAALNCIDVPTGREEMVRVCREAFRAGIGNGVREACARALRHWNPALDKADALAILDPEEMRADESAKAYRLFERAGWNAPWLREDYEPEEREDAEPGEDDLNPDAVPVPWRPFPVEALPDACADYARAGAKAQGVDPAFIAALILPVLAAAVGNAYRVKAKRSWAEIACLWVLLSKPSGAGGTPAFHKALAPIYEIQNRLWKEHEDALKAAGEGPEPEPKRLLIDDITVESALEKQAENPRGLLNAPEEASAFFGSLDAYKRGQSDRPKWIRFFEGKPITVDRKSGGTLHTDRANVSMVGTIQPGILRDMLEAGDFQSGFAARFLIVEPPVLPVRWSEADVEEETATRYVNLVKALYAVPYDAEAGPVDLKLQPDAKAAFTTFFNEHRRTLEALPEGPLRAAYSKLDRVCLRLALILHLADVAADEPERLPHAPDVSGGAMRRAVTLAEWARSEQRRVYKRHGFNRRAKTPEERFLDALPDAFETKDAEEAGKEHGISRSTVFRWLNDFTASGDLLKRGRGRYRKARDTSDTNTPQNGLEMGKVS